MSKRILCILVSNYHERLGVKRSVKYIPPRVQFRSCKHVQAQKEREALSQEVFTLYMMQESREKRGLEGLRNTECTLKKSEGLDKRK